MKTEPIDILLVDDNEDDIIIVREALDRAKLLNVIQVVYDGEEAMSYLRGEGEFADAKQPGLVLLDINMPKMNGFEVLEAMKADDGLNHIPVIMLTTSDRDEDIVKSYKDGACSFVTKPVDFEKLKQVVQDFSLYWALIAQIPPFNQFANHDGETP